MRSDFLFDLKSLRTNPIVKSVFSDTNLYINVVLISIGLVTLGGATVLYAVFSSSDSGFC